MWYICDRDLNASLNIKDIGIEILKNTLATKGIDGLKSIKACGAETVVSAMKQEKMGRSS